MSMFYLVMASAMGSSSLPEYGAMLSWGNPASGFLKLGDGTTAPRSSPVQVGAFTDWLSLSPGDSTVNGIRSDGTLWSWGNNGSGALGAGISSTVYSSPTQIGAETDWRAISCGYGTVAALRAGGSLYAWGWNNFYAVGDGTNTNRSSPIQIGGSNYFIQTSAGFYNVFAVRRDGTLWATGNSPSNGLGVAGHVSKLSQVSTVRRWFQASAGAGCSAAIATDGSLWTWGYGETYGALGLGNKNNYSTPQQVGSLTDWVKVCCGNQFMVALKADGTLWAWGLNNVGQLGQGNTVNRSSPVQVGSLTTWRAVAINMSYSLGSAQYVLAVQADGTLWAWGANSSGQLGLGDHTNRSSPVQVGSLTGWTNVFTGGGVISDTNGTASFALYNPDGGPPALPDPSQIGSRLLICGSNDHYNLAWPLSGTIAAFLLGAVNQRWVEVACRQDVNSYGVLENGKLYAVGSNVNGGLGTNDPTVYETPNPVVIGNLTGWSSVTVGAAIESGRIFCWGINTYGQLGDGTTTTRSSPVQVGALNTWAKVASNGESACAIKTDGTIWSWGRNNYGQHGTGNTTDRSSPVQIGALTNWADVVVSNQQDTTTVIALKTDGTLWGWGWNGDGRIGDGTTTNRSSPVQIGALTTWSQITTGFAIKQDKTLWSLASSPTQIAGTWDLVSSSGTSHYGLKSDGTLWAWGDNSRSQLGIPLGGSYISSPTQVTSMPSTEKITSIFAGVNCVAAFAA